MAEPRRYGHLSVLNYRSAPSACGRRSRLLLKLWRVDLKEMLQVCQGTGSKRGNSGIRETIIVCSVRGSDKLSHAMMKRTADDLSPALSLAESSVINYNIQHHSPVCLCCEDQAVMQIEEGSNFVCLQEDRRTPAGWPCGKPQTTLRISRPWTDPRFILFF